MVFSRDRCLGNVNEMKAAVYALAFGHASRLNINRQICEYDAVAM
jgi:hypothetical protein